MSAQRALPGFSGGGMVAAVSRAVLAVLGGRDARAARARPAPSRFDVPLVLAVVALCLLGAVMVFSASIALADSHRYHVTPGFYLLRHVIALTVAFAAAGVAVAIPIQAWQRLAPLIFVVAGVLLVAVLVPGVSKGVLGARRWIGYGGWNLQPSEMMKLACVLYAADFTVRKQDYMHDVRKGFAPMAGVMAVVGILLLLQPDLGACGVVVAIGMGILFLGGVNGRLFAAIVAALFMAFSALIWFSTWRRNRLFAYLDPWSDENVLKSGYQLTHSLIAFGRGEWFGVGLGASVEKLQYLPEAHTDFLLAVIGEELGLVGVLSVLLAFWWIVRRAFEIGRQAVALDRTFGGLVAQGAGLWIGLQVFINAGVATGLLPTKGLTLPLMSYGGSALLFTLAALGIVLRVDLENRRLMRGSGGAR